MRERTNGKVVVGVLTIVADDLFIFFSLTFNFFFRIIIGVISIIGYTVKR